MFPTGWKEPLKSFIPMYNIFLSLNSSYVPYGKMFMKSLYDVVDMSRVDRVVIADTGLDLKDKQYFLASYDKVDILETNLVSSFDQGGTWGKGWQSVVTSKAKYLLEALKKYDTTTVMVDGDCIFLKDISEIISDDDIQLCFRGDEKPDNPYLGSYTVFKPTDKSFRFIERWINNIDSNNSEQAKESPMLAKTVKEFDNNVINIARASVSCYTIKEYNNNPDGTYIVHFKGGSLSSDIEADIKKRIYGTHGFDKLVDKYL